MTLPTSVGLLCSDWTPDVGSEATHTEGLARALLAAGLRVSVLALQPDGTEPFTVRDTTVGGIHVRRMSVPVGAPGRFEDLLRSPNAERVVRDWLVATGPDLVHVQHLESYGFGVLDALAHSGHPVVVSLHDYWPVCARGGLIRPGGERCRYPEPETCASCLGNTWLGVSPSAAQVSARTRFGRTRLMSVDRVIVPSDAARTVYTAAGFDPGRIEVIPVGLEVQSLLMETRKARGTVRTSSGRRLGVLGAVRPEKGVVNLAHAVAMSGSSDLTLEVHGPLLEQHGDATYRNALKRIAEHEPRVRLHGNYSRADLPRILATLDAVALPSRWAEPAALSLREARAVGLPVLAAARGAALDLGRDPGVRLVYEEGIEAWVDALAGMSWRETEPVRGVSLLQATERLLHVYSSVWAGRTSRAQAL